MELKYVLAMKSAFYVQTAFACPLGHVPRHVELLCVAAGRLAAAGRPAVICCASESCEASLSRGIVLLAQSRPVDLLGILGQVHV